MRMEVYQGGITGEIVVGGVNAKVGIGNCGSRHVQRVNDLLKVRGRAIRRDLVGENGGRIGGGRKAKRTAYLTKGINKSHDQRSGHMSITKRSETDRKPI